jgi:O-antigen ligase
MVDRVIRQASQPLAEITTPDQRFGHRVGPLIVLAAVAAAVLLGNYVGEGGNLLVAGAGLVIIAAGVVVLSLPLLGLAAIVFVVATNASENLIEYFDLPSPAKLMLPAALLLLGYRWVGRGERPLIDPRATLLLGGYAALMLLSTPFALDWNGTMGAFSDFLKDATVALLIVAFFSRPRAMPVLFGTLFSAALFICTLSLYKHVFGDVTEDYYGFARTDIYTSRIQGPLPDPNYFGSFLIVYSIPAMYYLLYARSILLRWLGAYGVGVIIACIFLTQSRGTLVAMVAMAGVAVLLFDRRVALRMAVIVTLIGLASATVLSEQLVERYGTILTVTDADTAQDKSVQGRLAQWIVAANLFLDHPILGIGAGNYNVPFQDYSLDLGLMFRNGKDRAAHSLYLEVLAERGLVGFAWFTAILASVALGVRRAMASATAPGLQSLRGRCLCLGVGLAGYFTAMLFLHESFPRMMWMLVAIAIALPRIAAVEIESRRHA